MPRRFDQLVDSYFRSWFRFHPEEAVDIGMQGYAHLLTPFEDNEIGALISLDQKMLSALDEVAEEGLDPDRLLDADRLRAALSLELYELSDRDWRFHDPLRFLPLHALHQLTVRPVEGFRENLLSRLGLVPNSLRAARAFLDEAAPELPPMWVELAIEQANKGNGFLRSLPEHFKVRQLVARPRHLQEAVDAAAQALEGFAGFLAREIRPRAGGSVACGGEHYRRLLQQRQGVDADLSALRGFCEHHRSVAHDALLEACHERRGDADLAALRAQLLSGRQPVEVGALREQQARTREFLLEAAWVSLPETQAVSYVHCPDYLATVGCQPPYLPPVAGDPEQLAHFLVDGSPAGACAPRELELHAARWLLPGRHLAGLHANLRRQSSSYTRSLHPCDAQVLGWAHYVSWLTAQRGPQADGELRLLALDAAMRLALLARLDLDLHLQGLAPEQAVETLVHEGGLSVEAAWHAVAGLSRAPTRALAALFGAQCMQALYRRERAQPGAPLRALHDALLVDGPIPLPALIGRRFGTDVWQQIHAELLPRAAEGLADPR